MEEEKGRLFIFEGRRGLVAKIAFTKKKDGTNTEMPATGYTPSKGDESNYNDTPCTFRRDKGRLVELIAHDGKQLLPELRQTKTPEPISTNRHEQKRGHNRGVADSYDPSTTFLPKDTRTILSHSSPPDNFALKWGKAARFDTKMKKFQFFKRERKGENYEIRANYDRIQVEAIAAREHATAQALLGGANYLRKLEVNTDWRIVQGLGIESVYEVSMTLHHIYGLPYIPASALKGVVRGWIITEHFQGKESLAIADPTFCDWFGCPAELSIEENGKRVNPSSYYKEARQGKLVFFDMFPLNPPTLQVDVMNPHYQPYYSDSTNHTPPADYHSPIPVFFLTVADTRFQAMVGSLHKDALHATIESYDIATWLTSALQDHGIGAKTAVGYGYLK